MKTCFRSATLGFLLLAVRTHGEDVIAPVSGNPDQVAGDSVQESRPTGRWEPVPPVPASNQTNQDARPHLRTNPDCLAAYYDFSDMDRDSGQVKDNSGNGFDLGAVGDQFSGSEGIAGRGVKLEGSIFQAQGNPLAGTDHFTVSLWFKTAEPMNNYKLLSAAVWSGGNNASGWNIGTHYSEFWADQQQGSLRAEPAWERAVAFKKDAWNHLVITYDGARIREFINGQKALEVKGNGLLVGQGAPMVLGSWMGGFRFSGLMDEVRIYRRCLKQEEIQALYATPGGQP